MTTLRSRVDDVWKFNYSNGMPYSPKETEKLIADFLLWEAREDALTTSLLVQTYRHDSSRIMAAHGVVRRLRTMLHCMRRVYEVLPPKEADPSRLAMHDGEAFMQTFVINTYGVLDNLARIWCDETDLKTNKGKSLPDSHIGLGPKHSDVRASFSEAFQKRLAGFDAWFSYLENYRHALAHRIPLYIPPRTLDDDAQKEWDRLEMKMAVASSERRYEEYDKLSAEQRKLGVFQALMQHSYGGGERDGRPVELHGQVICDLATVVEIGDGVVAELKQRQT